MPIERQYVGARYVPKFADPLEWDSRRTYEALTIVTYLMDSFTSKKPVPAGVAPTDTRYWARTGAYNSQVEEYRQAVRDLTEHVDTVTTDLQGQITGNDTDILRLTNQYNALEPRVTKNTTDIAALATKQSQDVEDLTDMLHTDIQGVEAGYKAADSVLRQSILRLETASDVNLKAATGLIFEHSTTHDEIAQTSDSIITLSVCGRIIQMTAELVFQSPVTAASYQVRNYTNLFTNFPRAAYRGFGFWSDSQTTNNYVTFSWSRHSFWFSIPTGETVPANRTIYISCTAISENFA